MINTYYSTLCPYSIIKNIIIILNILHDYILIKEAEFRFNNSANITITIIEDFKNNLLILIHEKFSIN